MAVKKIGEEIYHIQSRGSGVHVAITGGVHGNELTGIEVVRQLLDLFLRGALILKQGTLTLALGNLSAIAQNTRGSVPGADLNRCFALHILSGPRQDYEANRARELAVVLEEVDILIDLHATNKPSDPFLYCQPFPTDAHARVYRWLGITSVLVDPLQVFGQGTPVAIDDYVTLQGGVGLCYETGHAADTTRVPRVLYEVISALQDQGLLHGTHDAQPFAPVSLYELTEEVLCSYRTTGFQGETFAWAPGLGEYSFQPFKSGQAIYSMNGTSRHATSRGVIVFPKPPHLIEEGRPVGYLARPR